MNARSAHLQTPASLGYRMPAEWEPHEATWIAWPHNQTDWPGKFEAIPWIYAEIVRYLALGEKVRIIANNAKQKAQAQRVLKDSAVDLSKVEFFVWPTDRGWMRDSGPIFVRKPGSKKTLITDWSFNAWAKYPDWKKDDLLPGRISRKLGILAVQPTVQLSGRARRVVLEGGSIDVNGKGVMLTTEECLLSDVQCRNPGMSRKQIEQVFADYLGIEKVVWLERGIVGDDTHGHVDDITRFVGERTILTAVERNRRDDNYKLLQQNLKTLRRASDQHGRRFEVIELPMPGPVVYKGQRLPASYANFYIANKSVLVPIFGDPNDREALNILARLFPTRAIAPIYCRDFIWGLGAIHCMTQQQPKP